MGLHTRVESTVTEFVFFFFLIFFLTFSHFFNKWQTILPDVISAARQEWISATYASQQRGGAAVCILTKVSEIRIISDKGKNDEILSESWNLK